MIRAGRDKLTEEEKNLERFFRRWNWTGARDDFFAMVKKRIGGTPEDRLVWVLALTQRDLSTLRPHEHVNLADDLRVCAALALEPVGGYRVKTDDMTKSELVDYLKEIDRGVRGILATDNEGKPTPKSWPFTAEPRLAIVNGEFAIQFSGDERAGILGGIAHLVVEVGDRFRACRECGNPFVAKARQARYCKSKCSYRRWNRERPRKEDSNG